jgi:hypothetical protein
MYASPLTNGGTVNPTMLAGASMPGYPTAGLGMMPSAGSVGQPPGTLPGTSPSFPPPPPPASSPSAGISPLAQILAALGGGAVGPRGAAAAAMPLSQQAAALTLDPTQQGGGGLSPSDVGSLIAAGGLV